MQTGAATMENSMEFPQKNKNETAFDPAIPLLGLYPNNPQTPIWNHIGTLVFTAVLFTTAKIWKQSEYLPVGE